MISPPMTLWVTRSSPFNLLTAQRLRAMGHGVLTVPLFQIRRMDSCAVPFDPELIAFTSVHGVRYHPYRAHWAHVPVITVGDRTAAAARRSGYLHVDSANGNLQDLQRLILRSAATGTRLIHFGAAEPAGDLSGYLRSRGFEAVFRKVYEAISLPLDEVQRALTHGTEVDGIVIHSPKSSRRVAQLIAETGWSGTVYCLSQACADELPLGRLISVASAPQPTEQSLMDLIRTVTVGRQEAGVQRPRMKTTAATACGCQLLIANDNYESEPTPA